MKVVHINIFCSRGSTGSIIQSIIQESQNQGIESYVIYGRGNGLDDGYHIKAAPEWIMKLQSLQAKITGNSYGGCWYSTRKIIKILKKIKPDVVHLHSINGYFVNIYKLLTYLKTNNVKTVLTLHAEFMYSGNCSHAYDCKKWIAGCGGCDKKMPERPKSFFFDKSKQNWEKLKAAYRNFDSLEVVAVSPWVKSRAEQSPFFASKNIKIILNGVDTEIYRYVEKINRGKEKVILYTTPDFNDELKGGKYVLELADRLKEYPVKIVMVGNNIPEELPRNVERIGYVDSKEKMADLYRNADITLLTSKGETFSMVCAESLCCGTPVVGFNAGGPESIALKNYTKFSEYGNIEQLFNACIDMLNSIKPVRMISDEAIEKYDQGIMALRYNKLYRA